jgi:chemotaxis protein methyltransferase CheR
MTASPAVFVRFQAVVAERLGLDVDRCVDPGAVMVDRAAEWGRPVAEYVEWLDRGPTDQELEKLAGTLCTAETYFFREAGHLRAFADLAAEDRPGRDRPVRVLSAGCAGGAEPYTVAMVTRGIPGRQIQITAVDISSTSLAEARQARYTLWKLRATPALDRARWFHVEDDLATLDDEIRGAVGFGRRNLADANADLWLPGYYDAIFCRNVLLYFAPRAAQRLVTRMVHALVPGGLLFLGAAELAWGRRSDLRLCDRHGSLYHQRPTEVGVPE